MLPKWHILIGFIFTFIIWIFAPGLHWIYLALIFLSSFLIDFDHYMCAVGDTGSFNLFKAGKYYKIIEIKEKEERSKGIRRRGNFHLFHTVEFHVLIGLLGILWLPLFYVFIGMVFHSLIDLFDLLKSDRLYRREYFFFNWLKDKS